MRFSTRQFIIGALIQIGLANSLAAAPLPRTGVFVYSSLCAGPEDAGGAEIILSRGPAGDIAVFTRTEGPIMAPLLAFGPSVKIDDRTGHITLKFVDPELGSGGVYLLEGSITDQKIELSNGIGEPKSLPRVKTFLSSLPKCRI